MRNVPNTIEYEGVAYATPYEEVILPHGVYKVECVELADPSVGIPHGYAMIVVEGYDEPLAIPDYEYDAYVYDRRSEGDC